MRAIRRELKDLYSPARRETELRRFRAAECGFADYFGTLGNARFFSAPARAEVCGTQTYHNNGKVMAASVDADIIAVAVPRDDNTIVIKPEHSDEIRVELNSLEPVEEERKTPAAVVRGIARGFGKYGHSAGGFNAFVTSDIGKNSALGERAAFETLIGSIFCHLYNEGQIPAVKIAQAGQFAEEKFYGEAGPLTDKLGCACGGFVAIDYRDSDTPIIEPIPFNLTDFNHALCIVDAKCPSENPKTLQREYDTIREEMREIAGFFDCETLRSLAAADIMLNINDLRREFGDRAVMRAIHFFSENDRVERCIHALKNGRIEDFLNAVKESGDSSFKYLQNAYMEDRLREQPLVIAINSAEHSLRRKGACRIHGDGFTGAIEAFVPLEALNEFRMNMEKVFGSGSCRVLNIRQTGVCEILLG